MSGSRPAATAPARPADIAHVRRGVRVESRRATTARSRGRRPGACGQVAAELPGGRPGLPGDQRPRPITRATPDDCAAFQRKALKLPKTTAASHYPRASRRSPPATAPTPSSSGRSPSRRPGSGPGGPAARSASAGVVDERSCWRTTPGGSSPGSRASTGPSASSTARSCSPCWTTWSASGPAYRGRADGQGLLLVLRPAVGSIGLTLGPAPDASAREWHFQVVGKWGVKKWFRCPQAVPGAARRPHRRPPRLRRLHGQLRQFHREERPGGRPGELVNETFSPACLGDWFHERLAEWSAACPKAGPTRTSSARPACSTPAAARTPAGRSPRTPGSARA